MDDPRPTPEAPSRPERRAPRFVDRGAGRARLRVAAKWQRAALELGLDDADRLGALIDTLVPDSSRSAGRAKTRVIETACGPLFLKRALKGGALSPLFAGRIPRFARALHELDATDRLAERGAPVLEPVLAAGVRDRLGWRAVVGTVFRPGTRDGASALAVVSDSPEHTDELARRMGRAIRAFHDAGGTHADLAITNLLVDPATGDVRIVDLQGAGVGAPPPAARRRLELRRLRRSIERRPEIRPLLERAWPRLEAACVGEAGYDGSEARGVGGRSGVEAGGRDGLAGLAADGVARDATSPIEPLGEPVARPR